MAKVPLPERGQPLDVTYIYQLAEAINNIATQVSSATYKLTTIRTASAGEQKIKTAEAKIVAGFEIVATNSTVSAGNEKPFAMELGSDFKFPPIVTATAINVGNTPAGQNVTVILKPPTTSRVEGIVRFGESGNLSLNVHIIAVGIPN